MPPEPVIAIAATPRDWAQRLYRHLADHGGGRIRATILSAREAVEEQYDVLVADDTTSFLSARLVEQLHQAGRAVVGLYDPQDPHGKGELVDCGVDEAVPCDTEAAALVATAHTFVIDRDTATTVLPAMTVSGTGPLRGTQSAAPSARLLCVGGPGGGCGTTEVALQLAASLSVRGRVVLLELDERRAALAPRLGLSPYPNLRSALDLARRGTTVTAALQAGGERLAVLVAAPVARRGDAPIPPDDLGMLLDDLRRQADWVVIDSGDAGAAGLTGADVVAVGLESPIGVLRLSAWLQAAATGSAPYVVVNRCGGSAFRRYEIASELARACTPAGIASVPEDPRVPEAGWHGAVVRRGPFTKALDRMASALATGAAA